MRSLFEKNIFFWLPWRIMSFRTDLPDSAPFIKQNSVQKSICRPIYRMIFPFFPLLDRPETHSSSKTAKLSLPYNPKTVPELIVRKCVSEPSCSDGHLVRIMGRRSVFACFTAFFDANLVRKMGILLCIEQVSYQCCFSCREKRPPGLNRADGGLL